MRTLQADTNNVPEAFIFDIDGVLADIGHRLPVCPGRPESTNQDWDVYHQAGTADPPILPQVILANKLWKAGYTIVLATNRPDSSRDLTVQWLERWDVHFDHLVMRMDQGHHGSKQFVVDWTRGRVNTVLALDDDIRHCDMYESQGIPAMYVHSGYYEGVTDEVYYGSNYIPPSGKSPEGWKGFYGSIGAVPASSIIYESHTDALQYHERCGQVHIITHPCPFPPKDPDRIV